MLAPTIATVRARCSTCRLTASSRVMCLINRSDRVAVGARAHDLDRARLRTLLAGFFSEHDLSADLHSLEATAEHAVLVKVDLVPISGLDRAELIDRAPLTDATVRRFLMSFHVQTMAPRLVLDLPSRDVERFLDHEPKVFAHAFHVELLDPFLFVEVLGGRMQGRSASHGNLVVRHRQVDVHTETVALLM